MVRRKRTSGEGGRRAKVCRVEHNDEPLVISDSDHEEEEDGTVTRSARAARWRRRGNKCQAQEMTEDEMLLMAMKMSAEEANSAAQRQLLEDNDMQKAIAESLNVVDKDNSVEVSSSSAQPQQRAEDTSSRLRRKLSFPSQNQTHGRQSPAAQGGLTESKTTSPLPEMPDLSQTTSNLVSSSPAQQVHESSQDKTSDKQPIIKDSEDDEQSQSVSQPNRSPLLPTDGSFIRQPLVYVEKLSQGLLRASTDSTEHSHTQNSSVGPTCSSISQPQQEDSSFPASHVFTQRDLRENRDDQSTSDGNESNTQIPDDLPTYQPEKQKGLSPQNTQAEDKSSSPCSRLQPSHPDCVPESSSADVTTTDKASDLQAVKDPDSQVEISTADSETTPNSPSWDKFTSHMVLHLTDDDEDNTSEEVRSPSPVFHDETAWPRPSPTQPCISSTAITLCPSKPHTQISHNALQDDSKTPKGLRSKSSDSKPLRTGVEKEECTVSYYWGVPFCPLGQNPDDYTRVIMCQLEVYEKSLKEAQRELLHKAEWSQPVFPDSSERPFATRRLKRNRAPQLSEDEEQSEKEGEEDNKRIEVEEEKGKAREESVAASEEAAEGEQSETYVVVSSPESKDGEVQRNDFLSQEEPTAGTSPFRNDPWEPSDDTQIEHLGEAQNQGHFEEEEMVCPETQFTENSTPEVMMTSPASPAQPQSRADSEVMEVDEEGGAPAVEEEEMMEQESTSAEAALPHSQRMECPICSKLFPLSKIEIHAAFCDGEVEDQNHQEQQSQVVTRRTRTAPTEETEHRSEKAAPQEKCQEYPAHVLSCFKKTDPKTERGNGLIPAIQRTEHRHSGSDEAGPSDVSARSNRGPSHPALPGTRLGSVNCSVTASPLSSSAFSCASDNTDRLTGLQQQDSKNSQRLARKRKHKK